jgi:hypothetical protein
VPDDAAVQISDVVLRNERGRPLCKVINCGKTEQAHNDGFCRTHFNLFVIDADEHGGIDGMKDPWMCVCGKQWPQMQKRCGNTKCQKVSTFLELSVSIVLDTLVFLTSFKSTLFLTVAWRKKRGVESFF